jgi:hypothetical protein
VTSDRLTKELLTDATLKALADFVAVTGEFRCPFALAGACSAAEDLCASGILNLSQFPESNRCTARAILSAYEFSMNS